MEISVNSDMKIIEVWLTSEDKKSAECAAQLKPLYKEYYDKKYLVAVFESGSQNLADAASGLLCFNKKHIAELELKKEKSQQMGI